MEENIIHLEDEEGNQVDYLVIDVYEFNGSVYFAMVENEDSDEVLIMKVDDTNEENPELIMVDDENELQAAFEEFQRREEEYDEEE